MKKDLCRESETFMIPGGFPGSGKGRRLLQRPTGEETGTTRSFNLVSNSRRAPVKHVEVKSG